MLCSDKPVISSFGQALYRNLFCFLSSLRQEVVSALLSHINTGVSSDINNALETLTFLATHYCSEMKRFSHRLKVGGVDGWGSTVICASHTCLFVGRAACIAWKNSLMPKQEVFIPC